MNEFKSKYKNSTINGIEFSAEILTNGHWPEQNTALCELPQELKWCT